MEFRKFDSLFKWLSLRSSSVLVSIGATLICMGCANPYSDHFQRFSGVGRGQSESISIRRSADLSKSSAGLIDRGYALLGVACFVDVDTGNRWDEVLRFGESEQAEIVLVWDAPIERSVITVPPGIARHDFRYGLGEPPDLLIPISTRAYCALPFARSKVQ